MLIDVLRAFPKTYFCIEFKTKTKEGVLEFLKVLREGNAMGRVITGSNKQSLMNLVRKKSPQLATWGTGTEGRKMLFSFILGFLPYVSFRNDFWMVPYLTKEFEDWERNEPYVKNGPEYLIMLKIFRFFFKPIVEHLTKRGMYVVPWVVNNKKDIGDVQKMGALGVMCDDPCLVDAFVTENDLLLSDV